MKSANEGRSRVPLAARIVPQAAEHGCVEIHAARAKLTSNESVAEHCFRDRAHRFDLLALSATRWACHRRAVGSGSGWDSAHQGRRFAQPAIPIQYTGVQDVRRGDTALPL